MPWLKTLRLINGLICTINARRNHTRGKAQNRRDYIMEQLSCRRAEFFALPIVVFIAAGSPAVSPLRIGYRLSAIRSEPKASSRYSLNIS